MNLRNKRIFIIEDNPSNLAVAKLILEPHGVVMWFDRWGKDIQERLREFSPVDLILLDLMFPDGLDGFTLYDQIRQVPGLEETPVVALTASDPTEAMIKAQKKGFKGYIAKPLDYDEFPKQIKAILGGEEVWQAYSF
jgi:CheY-like chemotaxis protein